MTGDPITNFEILGRETASSEALAPYAVDRLGDVKTQLEPLVEHCLALVPKESQPYTPIFALLGGGARALNAARRATLAQVVHQSLRLSCFAWSSVRNETVLQLSAQREAALAFAGSELAFGRERAQLLLDLTAGVVASRDGAGERVEVGALDGSTLSVAAPLLDVERDSALRAHLRALPFDAPRAQDWPCLPTGYERSVSVVKSDGRGYEYAVRGTSDASGCESLLVAQLQVLLLQVPVDDARRQLPAGTYTALSGLEAALLAVGEPGESSAADLLAGARALCSRSYEQLLAAGGNTIDEALVARCETALWSAVLLRDAYMAEADVRLSSENAGRAFRGAAAAGFVQEVAPSLPVGAPPRGVRCEELTVDLLHEGALPRVVTYQCDCVTFKNYQNAVHHISSDELLREVMPQFASAFLYPERFAAMDPTKYANEYRVCTSTDTPTGKYNYHCDVHENTGMIGDFIVREQRLFGNE